jgi:hypothetical protein
MVKQVWSQPVPRTEVKNVLYKNYYSFAFLGEGKILIVKTTDPQMCASPW